MSKVFRFLLQTVNDSGVHSVNDMLGKHLSELFDLLLPVIGAREVSVDGYRLLNERGRIHPLYPAENGGPGAGEGSDPLELYEPRINYIRKILESLLKVVDLEAGGKKVAVDSFRLKNPDGWLAPGGGGGDILAHAASRCNLGCRFCYNVGAPSTLRPPPRDPDEEYDEIRERIKHYVPNGRLGLFSNMGSPAEALAHPRIMDILRELRLKTDEPLRIPTNGSTLTPETIRSLAAFKPVYLDVSLNSSSPARRGWLMRDPDPRIALNSLALLGKERVPYSVVIVPWPFPSVEDMLEDLETTVLFAVDHDPTLIQISLPGYSKHVSEEVVFDTEQVWSALKTRCLELRTRTDCPLVIRPGLYEEYTEVETLNEPDVVGVVRNSPVDRAGLRRGDRLRKINGLSVKSRFQARSLLTVLHGSGLSETSVSIQRDGVGLELEVDLSAFEYPYTPETAVHLGAVFGSSGIPGDWLERLGEVVSVRGAKEVLLLTSSLVEPYLKYACRRSGFPGLGELHIRVPRNTYFGGNIQMGDLLVVSDFIEAVEAFIDETKIRPDLVLVPSSPFDISGWSRDLAGSCYLEIERSTGVPVALVECDPIFD
ncbi:MAG: radical SAM protein [Proteobacteria bacterium]|nr:radical SAM protein [Pseudomonadota bacterium]